MDRESLMVHMTNFKKGYSTPDGYMAIMSALANGKPIPSFEHALKVGYNLVMGTAIEILEVKLETTSLLIANGIFVKYVQ